MTQELAEMRAWAAPGGAVVAGFALGIAARVILIPLLQRLASKTTMRYDDVLVDSIKGPIVLWCVLIGVRVALRLLDIERETEALLTRIALIIAILSVTWAAGRFAAGMTREFAAKGALPGVSLLANIALFVIMIIGVLIALQTLGIAITPVITALGVGGLAVGLALQDTLANLFAGIRLLAGGRIRRGDFIRLESGQDGWIEDIAWSVTTIRGGLNDMVIVPNARLAQGITTNYALPDTTHMLAIGLRVAQDSDLEKIERILIEVGSQAQQASREGVGEHTPVVRFQEFSDVGIRCQVVLKARSYPERGALQHEFLKLLQKRFQQEGVVVPQAVLPAPASR